MNLHPWERGGYILVRTERCAGCPKPTDKERHIASVSSHFEPRTLALATDRALERKASRLRGTRAVVDAKKISDPLARAAALATIDYITQ